MMTANYALLCENAILDQDGRVSFINVFDIIKATGVPTSRDQMYYAVNLSLQAEDVREDTPIILFSLISPSGAVLVKDRQLDGRKVEKKEQKYGVLINLAGIMLAEWGMYKIKLHQNSDTIVETTFEVIKVGEI
jgi:hypothetical protein